MSALLSPPGSIPGREDMRSIAAWLIDGVIPCSEGLRSIGRGILSLLGDKQPCLYPLSDGRRCAECETCHPVEEAP